MSRAVATSRSPRRLALCALLVLSSVACSTLPRRGSLQMVPSGEAASAEPWEQVVAEHTRKVEVYEWAVRQVDLRATLVTPRLRTAFMGAQERLHGRVADELKRDLIDLGVPPDEGTSRPLGTRPRAEEEILVYVCFYVADQKNRDLAAGYSIWDTELVRGATRVEPMRIDAMKYSPALEALLPHADRFDEVYALRFPLVDSESGELIFGPGDPPLRLEVRSALGAAVVEWTLRVP